MPLAPGSDGITREDIRQAIKSFRNGSGGGPDGLLPQHLKDMTGAQLGDAAINLLDTLTYFLNEVVVSSQIPDWIRPIFYGARLVTLSKSDSGIRPITMGLTLRRLAGKVAV